jgi:osmoprotectant transport system substrate-binding protein
MFTAKKGRLLALGAVAVGASIALAGCSSSSPLATKTSGPKGTIVVGSQAYYEDVTIAEIYSQALENGGYKVTRDFNIGQRAVYLPQLKNGKIDLFPEYEGDFLQQGGFGQEKASGDADKIYSTLKSSLPSNLRVLDKAAASDGNSYTTTQDYAKKYHLTDVASLKKAPQPVTVGGNPELQSRVGYGLDTLKSKYGIDTTLTTVGDNGGPLTLKALVGGTVHIANIYTADPNIKSNHLVALADPDGIFLPDNIVPIASKKVDSGAAAIINKVQAKLSQSELLKLNDESVNQKLAAPAIAKAWLKAEGLVK